MTKGVRGGTSGSGPATATKAPPPPPLEVVPDPATMDPVDRTIAEALKALEDGDDERAGELFDEASRLEREAKAVEDRKAKAEEAKARKEQAKYERMAQLMDQGVSGPEAEAEAFGRSIDYIRRRDFMKSAREDGYTGKGFDDLMTAVHARYVAEQYIQAEDATRARMVRSKYDLSFDPKNLWTVNEATARKVMSPEMAEWFDRNGGRITKAMYRKAILGGLDKFDNAMVEDFLR